MSYRLQRMGRPTIFRKLCGSTRRILLASRNPQSRRTKDGSRMQWASGQVYPIPQLRANEHF
jgi:hypothetical protein